VPTPETTFNRCVAKARELLAADWCSKAPTLEIIESAIGGCGAPCERFDITGRDFNVSPGTAVEVAFAIHELVTNAFKCGALSNDLGR
jgi:two-component sensor histidine kinase